MKNKYLFALFLSFILFLAVSSVSAEDNETFLESSDDSVSVGVSNSEVEVVSQENDDSQIIGVSDSDNDVLSQSSTVASAQKSEHTFTDLKNEIANAGPVLVISGTYKFNKNTDADLINGVRLPSIKIIGSGRCIIDGAGAARCLLTNAQRTITLENLIIQNGYVKNANGAGLVVSKNVKITIKNCIFQNNVVYNANGGAISVSLGDKVVIKSCKFLNNQAIRVSKLSWEKFKKGMGGAILGTIGTNIKIYDSTFKSNKAFVSTILVVSKSPMGKKTSKLYVKNSVFEKNKSNRDGVIYLDEFGKGKILNSVFTKNSSPKGSGTVIFDASLTGVIKNCEFKNNKARSGGGICIRVVNNKYKSNVKITSCKFTSNYASHHGGAIFSVKGKVVLKKCTFIKNKASRYGGAIFAESSTLKMSKCKFSKNKAPHGPKKYFNSVKT